MPLARAQTTLAQPAVVDGRGYWSGQEIKVEFRPAPVDSGVTFVRSDLPDSPQISATIAHQQPADRRTILAAGGTRVEMVEHILAALTGLGIDNCQVAMNGAEAPGLDGSSLAFVQAIVTAGVVEQSADVQPLIVDKPIRCAISDRWIEARPPIGDCLSVEYSLDYGPDGAIRPQWFVAEVTPQAFCEEISPARTFLLEAEADAIRAQGLAQHVRPQDLLIFSHYGPIDNSLRFEDECARHKMLDVIGDLSLAGRPIIGHIVACRSGHRLNGDLVRALLDQIQEESFRKSA